MVVRAKLPTFTAKRAATFHPINTWRSRAGSDFHFHTQARTPVVLPPLPPPSARGYMLPRLALPNNRPVFGASTLAVGAGALATTSTLPVAGLVGDIFFTPNPFLSPGIFVPVATGSASTSPLFSSLGPSLKLLPFGLLGVDIIQASSAYNVGLVYLTASSIGLYGIHSQPGVASHTLLGTFGNGFASLGYSSYAYSPNMLHASSFLLAAWRDYVGAGVQYVSINRLTGHILLAGGQVGLQARRDISDAGPLQGVLAGALAKSHNLAEGASVRRYEYLRRNGVTLSLRAAAGVMVLMGMLRTEMLFSRETAYRSVTNTDAAYQLLYGERGLKKYLLEKSRALGLTREPVVVPKLKEPETIPVGDELVISRSGTFVLGGLVGSLSAWGAINLTYRGDLEVSVRKVNTKVVEVTLTPTRAQAITAYGMQPFGPHFGLRYAQTYVTRQSFLIDLTQASARKMYDDAVGGKPPVAFHSQRSFAMELGRSLATLVQDAKNALPLGVHYNFVHLIKAGVGDGGGGLKFLLIPREILPHGWEAALTWHHQRGHEAQTLSDGKDILETDARTHKSMSERLTSGLKATTVASSARWRSTLTQAPAFEGLTLNVQLSDSKIGRTGFNRRFVKRLNKHLELNLNQSLRRHRNEERQVQVSRVLQADNLDRLSAIHGQTAAALHISSVARASRLRHGSVQRLVTAMAQSDGDIGRIDNLQRFIQRHGIRGLGAVHRLLEGRPADLTCRTASSTYDTGIGGGEKLAFKYRAPANTLTKRRPLEKRLRELSQALELTHRATYDLEEDAFLEAPAKQSLRNALSRSQERLHSAWELPSSAAPALMHATERHIFPHRWKRDLQNVTQAEEPVLATAWALIQSVSPQPMPDSSKAALERYKAVFPTATQLRARLQVLQDAGYLVPAARRQALEKNYQGALAGLVGVGSPPESPAGLLDFSHLAKETQQQLIVNLRANFRHDGSARNLAEAIEARLSGRVAPTAPAMLAEPVRP